MLVLIIVKKDILNKLIIENRTDLISHLHYILLDMRECNPGFRKYLRRTKVVNFYDIKIGNGCI